MQAITPKLPRWRAKGALVLAALAALGSPAVGLGPVQAQQASEAGVKAAYLYRFLAYVDWPPAALPGTGNPFVIGVVGAEAVGQELQAIVAGRQVNGHAVASRQLAAADSLDGVHVVFVGRGADGAVLERVRGRPVLVVAEAGLDPGVMLNFVPVAGRVRFEAAPAAAERVGVKLGARLLALAERVAAP